jgi:hypothetical protein
VSASSGNPISLASGPRPLKTYNTSVTVYANNAAIGITHYSFGVTRDDPFRKEGAFVSTIQLTAGGTNTSSAFVAYYCNLTSEGFDIVVGCTGGGWTGAIRVDITINGFIPTIII